MFLNWLPENISTYGGEIDAIFRLIYYITLAWFIVTMGALLGFVLLFRRRDGQRATYVTGEKLSGAAWLLIPTVYRGPYEYSPPGVREDYLPQDRALAARSA